MGAGKFTYKEVTIADGASLSDEASLIGHQLVAIYVPAGIEGTALTFQARPGVARDPKAHANEALANVYDDAGTEVSVTVAASARYVALTGAKLDALTGCGAVKVRSGTAAAPQNQTGAITLTLVLLPIT
jgi:hypothetical protein